MLTSGRMIPTFHKGPTIPTFNRGSTTLTSHRVNTLIPTCRQDKMSRQGNTIPTCRQDKMSRQDNIIPTFRRSSTIPMFRRGNITLNHQHLRLLAGGNEIPSVQSLDLFGFLMYPFNSEGGVGNMFSRSG